MSKNYEVYFTNPDSPMFLEQWLENLLQDNRELVTFSEGYWIFRIVEPSPSDVSMTQDVLTDIKTGRSVENTNPDYYNRTKTSTDNNKCWWTKPEVFPNLWRAGCGNSFYLDAEKPSDNHMKYCCYCGKEIAEGE